MIFQLGTILRQKMMSYFASEVKLSPTSGGIGPPRYLQVSLKSLDLVGECLDPGNLRVKRVEQRRRSPLGVNH